MKKALLPQANNLDVLVEVLRYISKNMGCSSTEIAKYIGYEDRQGAYYNSACYYFGLVNEKNYLTELGIDAVSNNATRIKPYIYAIIITDPIIGEVFAKRIFRLTDDINKFTVDLLKRYFDTYSESVIKRRASTILAWINEIIDFLGINLNCFFNLK